MLIEPFIPVMAIIAEENIKTILPEPKALVALTSNNIVFYYDPIDIPVKPSFSIFIALL